MLNSPDRRFTNAPIPAYVLPWAPLTCSAAEDQTLGPRLAGILPTGF